MMTPRFIVAALCMFGLLTGVSYGGSINGEATYISFSVPGALGTYPLGINASMEITGSYTVSSTEERGFLRAADGAITTFDVAGLDRTVPQSINAAGDIAGVYAPQSGEAQGFLRYADGRIITIVRTGDMSVFPVSISDFDDIAGNYFDNGIRIFSRLRTGEFTTLPFNGAATAINASGSIVGVVFATNGFTGFVAHPDGYTAPIGPSASSACGDQTIPYAINAAGVIAGEYTQNYFASSSCPQNTGGFVLLPGGEFTPFQPPGQMLTVHDLDLGPGSSLLHLVSIDEAGDIAGSYLDAAWVLHGFVRNPYGTISSFDPPECKATEVTSIDEGMIAGYCQSGRNGAGLIVGFVRMPQS
jgi:hypothetical protein